MLVELGLVEQRYQAVLEVLNDGATMTDVARRYGKAWCRTSRAPASKPPPASWATGRREEVAWS